LGFFISLGQTVKFALKALKNFVVKALKNFVVKALKNFALTCF